MLQPPSVNMPFNLLQSTADSMGSAECAYAAGYESLPHHKMAADEDAIPRWWNGLDHLGLARQTSSAIPRFRI